MLDDGRQAHLERLRQLADRGGAAAEAFHQVTPGGIPQCPEHVVDRLILKH